MHGLAERAPASHEIRSMATGARSDRRVLLVPIDFSEPSRRALSFAVELGARLGGEVVLAHVLELPVHAYPSGDVVATPRLWDAVVRLATRSLEELAASHGGLRAIVREGPRVQALLEIAEELQPSLVVVGARRRRGLARALAGGGTAARLARRSRWPVLVVPVVGAGERARAA